MFAALGYDEATAAAVAARAGISPGSLYQLFPNKEAIARALGARYTEQLRSVHAAALASNDPRLPLADFMDRIVDPIVAFNRAHPALMRLFGGRHVSPRLAGLLDDLHAEVVDRFDAAFEARLPHLPAERRRRMVVVSLQVALSLLPLTLDPDVDVGSAIATELKALLARYWAPVHQA